MIDEFVGTGEARNATPLELGRGWEARLSALTNKTAQPLDVSLPAFTLIKGGDLFQPSKKKPRLPTEPELLDRYKELRLRLIHNKVSATERETAMAGVMRVLAGNPALCRRMLLGKPIDLVLVPKGKDFRSYGFPPHTNPNALGIFWSSPKDERALVGLREEHIASKPYLMVHEMTHAVHFLALTAAEREAIDKHLLPTYRYQRWVEEVVAIHAERAFGAAYTPDDMRAPEPYGRVRREWTDRAVFSLFIDELLRPR